MLRQDYVCVQTGDGRIISLETGAAEEAFLGVQVGCVLFLLRSQVLQYQTGVSPSVLSKHLTAVYLELSGNKKAFELAGPVSESLLYS